MVETDLHISKRLKALLPPLTDEQRKQLEDNIVADGKVIDDILWWNDGKRKVVVDGMTRWEIIHRLGNIEYDTQELKGACKTYEEIEAWIWNHQAGRRNLTRETIGLWYNQIKTNKGGDHTSKPANASLLNAAEHIAEAAGISPATVQRDGARVDALAKCIPAVQKVADKLTDADVKTLVKLSHEDQTTIAADLRKTVTKTAKESIKLHGIKAPAPPKPAGKKPKPPVKPLVGAEKEISDARYQVGIWKDAVGRWLVSIDGYRAKYPGKQGDHVIKMAKQLFEAMGNWQKVIK